MKKIMMTLVAMLTIAATGKAMSYEQARNEALFLTDKMAYELNLTDEQYEAAYEINLDYLMGVTSYDDVYSTYWERRNLDMSYILFDWQWQAFCAATYFYRPLYWDGGYWHFAIYARYPHRDYFYFGRPVFYASYRGGHAWHVHGGHGYYYGRRDHYRPAGRSHFGMLDRWNRGDYRGHHPSGQRHSSTRTTAGDRRFGHLDNGNRGNRPSGNRDYRGDDRRPSTGNRPSSSGNSGRSFGHSGSSSSSSRPSMSNSRTTYSRSSSSERATTMQRPSSSDSRPVAVAVRSAVAAAHAAAVHSAEATAVAAVAEVPSAVAVMAAVTAAEAARSADVVNTRTSAFIMRCTSLMGHCA